MRTITVFFLIIMLLSISCSTSKILKKNSLRNKKSAHAKAQSAAQ